MYNYNSVERRYSSPEAEQLRKERLRDGLFHQLIASRVLDDFDDDLACADFPEEAHEEFEREFAALSEDDKRAVLAVPAQLRPIQFGKYAERLNRGEMSGKDVLMDMLQKAKRYGYTLGFHLSLYDIKPAPDGSWYIRGTEPDHRHNDLPMAYYSMDYSNRYDQKRVQYLYVIRAETGENTSHYQDNDGTWGHASNLSIISQIDMQEVEKQLDERFKETIEKTKGDDAIISAAPVQPSAT
jgi:hypothetical protein